MKRLMKAHLVIPLTRIIASSTVKNIYYTVLYLHCTHLLVFSNKINTLFPTNSSRLRVQMKNHVSVIFNSANMALSRSQLDWPKGQMHLTKLQLKTLISNLSNSIGAFLKPKVQHKWAIMCIALAYVHCECAAYITTIHL
jgi:membrane-anchored protein YejM (alkaline phosphatase superfamily)